MRPVRSILLGSVCAAMLSAASHAAEVKLFAEDDSINIVGDLVSYTDTTYVLKTALGDMVVNRDRVKCQGETCPPEEAEQLFDIVIHGSDTVGEELMPLLVEGYAAKRRAAVARREDIGDNRVALAVADDFGSGDPVIDVQIQSKGSSTGFKSLIAREADIAMSSRPVRPSEVDAIAGAGRGDLNDVRQEYIVAVDSIMTVVSPENPVGELTVGQLADLFAGRISNWSEVGGPDLPVTVYSRNTDSGTFGVFEDQVLKPAGRTLSADAVILGSNDAIADAVVQDAGGIGYVGFAYVRDAKTVDLIASCGIRMSSSVFAAKTEEYPLERRLRLYVDNSDMTEHVRGLLDYAISADAEPLVQKAGFIDLGVIEDESGLDSARLMDAAETANDTYALKLLRTMMIDLGGAKRLSTTFRFAPGSSQLDNKAERDLGRMIAYLSRPENADREVLLVGFTDSDGAFSANAALSEGRAQAALDALLAHPEADRLAGLRMRATGYGELSPVGCNDDFKGRQRNRRVEVWLRVPGQIASR